MDQSESLLLLLGGVRRVAPPTGCDVTGKSPAGAGIRQTVPPTGCDVTGGGVSA